MDTNLGLVGSAACDDDVEDGIVVTVILVNSFPSC
jgi:hypothetical protein